MRYNKGDIVVCSTNTLYGHVVNSLVIGDQYIIDDVIEMSEDRVVLSTIHKNTMMNVGINSDRLFIPLDVYREFKLREILK